MYYKYFISYTNSIKDVINAGFPVIATIGADIIALAPVAAYEVISVYSNTMKFIKGRNVMKF